MPFRARSPSAAVYAALAGRCEDLADIDFILEKPWQRYISLGFYTSEFSERLFLFISIVRDSPIDCFINCNLFGFFRKFVLYGSNCSAFSEEIKIDIFNTSEFPEGSIQLISINRDIPEVCFSLFYILRDFPNR